MANQRDQTPKGQWVAEPQTTINNILVWHERVTLQRDQPNIPKKKTFGGAGGGWDGGVDGGTGLVGGDGG